MDENDRRSAVRTLLHGRPGHPLHPPLTDATIGMFVLATGLAILGQFAALGGAAGKACWLGLVGGLIAAAPTAATGFADWVTLEWGSARWRAATHHLTAMLCAVVLFAIATWVQHPGYTHGTVTTGGLIFSVLGFVALTAGGWLGGAIVFVHGMRVIAGDPPAGAGEHEASSEPGDPPARPGDTPRTTTLRR